MGDTQKRRYDLEQTSVYLSLPFVSQRTNRESYRTALQMLFSPEGLSYIALLERRREGQDSSITEVALFPSKTLEFLGIEQSPKFPYRLHTFASNRGIPMLTKSAFSKKQGRIIHSQKSILRSSDDSERKGLLALISLGPVSPKGVYVGVFEPSIELFDYLQIRG